MSVNATANEQPIENRVDSPCVRKCCLDDNDICVGCFRSLEEIRQWSQADDDTRQCFLANAASREEGYQQKGWSL
jgi:predicted Fe-S protein YdhL (DUF1289 family)